MQYLITQLNKGAQIRQDNENCCEYIECWSSNAVEQLPTWNKDKKYTI